MTIAGRICRPGVLAAIFGTYFGVVMLIAWSFASNLTVTWFDSALTRWVYMTQILASTVFLVGLALLSFHIQNVFGDRVREINRQLGIIIWSGVTSTEDVEIPPAAKKAEAELGEDDPTQRDLDEMLEVLGEAQNQEVLGPTSGTDGGQEEEMEAEEIMVRRDLVRRRTGLRQQQDFLTRFLPGPMAVAVIILGISMALLPASDGMLQSLFHLNTAIILGFSYGWFGLAAYFATSLLGIVGSLRTERKRRLRVPSGRDSGSQGDARASRIQRAH